MSILTNCAQPMNEWPGVVVIVALLATLVAIVWMFAR